MKKIFFWIAILSLLSLSWFVAKDKYRYNILHNAQFFTPIEEVMSKPLNVLLQYIVPQHALTQLAGWLGECRSPWLKNFLIQSFIKRYQVNMTDAVTEDPTQYPTFNNFFTRAIKSEKRPLAEDPHVVVSPVDGIVSQAGIIQQGTLIQAKGFDFSVKNLLGGSEKRSKPFEDGSFVTFYLSPKDYHRVHMPVTGQLKESIYIPGDLFSVNPGTCQHVGHLFARNERLVAVFDTEFGPMAIVLVGAMIVGSIHTVWHATNQSNHILVESYAGSLTLLRGQEMGHFQLGSTVIVLFAKNKVRWDEILVENAQVKMGQSIATPSN